MHRSFGQLPDGTEIQAFTLRSDAGLEAEILSYGGILRRLGLATAQGRVELVLGLPDLPAYVADRDSLGILVGRFGNRIAGGRFALDGVVHRLSCNEGRHHLHGGTRGFGRRAWTVRASAPSSLRLGYRSPAGEEGYPGTLEVEAEFRLEGRRLTLVYTAHSDAPTPLNLTHHPYFNLAGDPAVAAAAQVLRVPADRYLPVDAELIPTGEIAATAGTPFDFRAPAPLQERAGPGHPQLESAGGYDTCLVLADTRTCSAELYSPHSGVALRLSSAMPAVQLYEGQGLDRRHPGLGRGVCLEPQAYPDAPNQPRFPETILRPGQVHTHRIDYLFAEAGRDAPWAQVAAALDAESAGAAP